MTVYPKPLIELNLPIRRISAHARRAKPTRNGHAIVRQPSEVCAESSDAEASSRPRSGDSSIFARPVNTSRKLSRAPTDLPCRPRREASGASALLHDAEAQLQRILKDEAIMAETPIEAQSAMESAFEAIRAALRQPEPDGAAKPRSPALPRDGPTRQQGQFLAFIQQYMMRNETGVAPTYTDLQRFFNLTAPSVNSMLVRLERRGFIRRTPGRARGIHLTVKPDWIPPLDRPFQS